MMQHSLILGTVQLGLPYGIANTTGKPDQSMANAIVAAAWEQGITTFDTAQGYGDSEAVLGRALHACGAADQARIITKLSPDLPMTGLEIKASLCASRNRLGVSAFFCVMLHREEHLSFLDAHAGATLTEQRTAGLLEHIGVSVYTPEKALEALRHPLVDIVQVPASLFDRRFEAAGVFALAHETGKQVHVRSAFLQGVLLMPPQHLPACLQELSPALKHFHQICAAEGLRPALAALLWLQQRYPGAAILFGAETQEQVRDNLDSAVWNKGLSPACIRRLDAILPPQKPELLNPSLWKRYFAMSKSLDFQAHARTRIPSMTQLLSKRPDMFSLGVWPGYYSKAKGATVWDLDGKEYLDMSIGGIGACVLGYADDEVDDAVIATIRNGVASSLNCPEEVELADVLCELHPWAQMVRYTRSGGEALALAVRLARAHTDRDVVAFCGYHGWSDWYLAANLAENKALDGHLLPGLEPAGVPRGLRGSSYPFRYNHAEELQAIADRCKGQLAAIVMEPIRSEDPLPGFVEQVRAIADATGAVLIMDEVSAGFRYCTGGAHLVKHSVTPDMAVFSKALGNGYAISAIIGREDVMQAAQKSFVSSTNWTDRVGPTAALATLRKYRREEPFHKFTAFGSRIKREWVRLGEKHGFVTHAEGMEAMAHFSFDHPDFLSFKAYFVQLMLERGILASNLCYLMNSHTEADIDRYLDACDQCFALLAEARDAGDIEQRLKGAPACSGFKRLA